MPSVTIDAGILAVPQGESSSADAKSYVETLLDWSLLLREPWVGIYMSERASTVLFEDGLFPSRDQIKGLFTANGIVEFDFNTTVQVVDLLLKLTPSFETYFSIRDVLPDQLGIEPDILNICSGVSLQSDLTRCVVLIAILGKHCQEPINDHFLILRKAPGKTVRVRAQIHELEHDRTDLAAVPKPPEFFEGDVLVCDDLRGLIECLDEAGILIDATDDVCIETAIRIAVYRFRLRNGMDPKWEDVPAHQVGSFFRKSLERLHLTHKQASKILFSIAESLEQIRMSDTHALRTGAGGGNPQLLRRIDQAGAWRRDIDDEHHLHYWQCEGGRIEFAWLSFPHADMTIPE
ncbi:MAG: hypothetical protein ABSF70_13585 [Terracidiphilus sp.]|jgi:hypothetical protein